MSDPQQGRPEVVDAIFDVLKGADPEGLPADATREEKDAAKDRYLSEVLAERSKRDRQAQAGELWLPRSYDEPPTWQQIFDDLSPEALEELGSLYDALPAGAQEEYQRRFGVPSAVCPARPPPARKPAMTRPLTAPGRLVAGRYRLLSQIGG